MLQSLYIKNFALIDEISIDFQPGLNIFLGETGAGKSIIIDALMTTLGERTSPEFVKSGTSKSIVEATFSIENPDTLNSLLNDSEKTIQDTIILRREISSKGASRCFLNDTPYPLNTIKEIGELLVDFHGQHTHQQLLAPKFQIELLDSISGNAENIAKYKSLKKDLEETIQDLSKLEQELQRYYQEKEKSNYDLQELLRIDPQPNEIDKIEEELKKLENIEIINTTLNEVYEILYNSENSIVDLTSLSIKKLGNLTKFDPTVESLTTQLEQVLEQISDISKEIKGKTIETEFEPDYIEQLRTRLSELKYLEKKYLSYENIFAEKEKLQKIILSTYSLEEQIKEKENKIKQLRKEIKDIAIQIHNKRKDGIQLLERKLPEILEKLGMRNVVFKVSINSEEQENTGLKDPSIELEGKFVKLFSQGIDKVEFLIATNPNTKPLPLSNIASGGELSRIMLALKSITAEFYNFPTMIFDEIDAGISGKIASMTAHLMKQISRKHQIIAITHLPQIASAGDNTILVEKQQLDGDVKITARKLSPDEKIVEIARLLSGESISESAIENAKKLITEINKGEISEK